MPVKTGIQVRFWLKFKTRLDFGVRRKDRKNSRLSVDHARILGF